LKKCIGSILHEILEQNLTKLGIQEYLKYAIMGSYNEAFVRI
jgi:hypothetical protein